MERITENADTNTISNQEKRMKSASNAVEHVPQLLNSKMELAAMLAKEFVAGLQRVVKLVGMRTKKFAHFDWPQIVKQIHTKFSSVKSKYALVKIP